MSEQVIVITGASSGIGLATAESAAEQGAKLVLAARSGETLDEVAARLSQNGAEAMAVDADVANRVDVEQIALAAIERFGRIDTWVNNAGVSIYGRLDEVSDQDSRRLFDTNFWGVVNGSLVALKHLRVNGGAIINLGSEVSDAVLPLQGMYAASKHAVKGFTDALRVEVEEVDQAPVAITLIQPTAVDTPYTEHARNYMSKQPKLPIDPIDPGEVAEAILKAASNHSRDVKVGAMSKINTTVAKVLPKVGDKMAAKMVDKQKRDEPPRDPRGGLHEGRGGGRTHGR
ncbi:MAG TPA: SDR family oxidoreductase [Polyangia bacterium]|nr:SDR family oxidoreductase [Polyangia bacterium]